MPVVRKSIISIISLTTFLFFAPLEIAFSIWSKFILKQDRAISLSFIQQAYAVVLSSVEEALQVLLPAAQEIKQEIKVLTAEQKQAIEEKAKVKLDPQLDKEFTFFIGSANGQVMGYVIRDTVKGKWGPIHYMLGLDLKGRITDTVVLEYREKRGRPVAKRRFLKQFVGKTVQDKIKLNKDIRGISGASISSRGMVNGIRKSVHVFNKVYAENIYAKRD